MKRYRVEFTEGYVKILDANNEQDARRFAIEKAKQLRWFGGSPPKDIKCVTVLDD